MPQSRAPSSGNTPSQKRAAPLLYALAWFNPQNARFFETLNNGRTTTQRKSSEEAWPPKAFERKTQDGREVVKTPPQKSFLLLFIITWEKVKSSRPHVLLLLLVFRVLDTNFTFAGFIFFVLCLSVCLSVCLSLSYETLPIPSMSSTRMNSSSIMYSFARFLIFRTARLIFCSTTNQRLMLRRARRAISRRNISS